MHYVAVVGPSDASPAEIEAAELIGPGIAQRGDVLVCGGLGGVMALKIGVPVIGLRTREIEGIDVVDSPEHALCAIQQRT